MTNDIQTKNFSHCAFFIKLWQRKQHHRLVHVLFHDMTGKQSNLLTSQQVIDLTNINKLNDDCTLQDTYEIEAEIQHQIEEELCVEEEDQHLTWWANLCWNRESAMHWMHPSSRNSDGGQPSTSATAWGERERLEAECRVRIRIAANKMREASPNRFLPLITQVECVMIELYSVFEAIIRGADNQTPCQRCSWNDPDECFWLAKTVFMNLEGWWIQQGRGWQNNQVQHYLYRSFIKEEYGYLLDGIDEDNVEGCIGIPHMPLPTCVEQYIKRQFFNEDGRPLVGFWGPARHGGRKWQHKHDQVNIFWRLP